MSQPAYNMIEAARAEGWAFKPFGDHQRYYVYFLIDPRNQAIFYVGKGKRDRYKAHEREARGKGCNPEKRQRIRAIWNVGLQVETVCFQDGLSESDAIRLERMIIFDLGFESLTNSAPGMMSVRCKAERMLANRTPFDEWLRLKPWTEKEIGIYHYIFDSLKKLIAMEEADSACA